MNYKKILHEKFGLQDFRPWQLEIIESVLNGNDTLVFMPTWWWKSLTYQFPGVVLSGVTIVISPLISLMKDQVDKLNSLWIKSRLINSSISSYEKEEILFELSWIDNEIKFLYIAPERLNDNNFLQVIKNINISLLAIDEAHCISQWGHDFRPSYLKIKYFIQSVKSIKITPIIALTATATPKVRQDIIERLSIKSPNSFTTWFDRKNLIYIVREITKEQEKLQKLSEIISKTPPFWIIYCSSVKNVSKVYQYLLENWVKVWIYTWEMKQALRETEQNSFMNWEYDVMVATNAFWMWIDKSDIRYVIHYNLPWSIENFYQEAWRAWRDGKMSYSIVLASYQDTIIQEFFIENTYPPKEEILKLYDYLYKNFDIWEWSWTQILETYANLAVKSWIKSDMMVWSIVKIFEKYLILERWFDANNDENNFRWRWLTLILDKKNNSEIPILWNHQNILKQESYFKLEQVKKLLFKPWCRKRFILEYFADQDDLKNLKDNCWMCDFCIDKKKFESLWNKEIIPHNVFFIILDFVKRLDEKFWSQLLAGILTWSKEQRIIEWNLDIDKSHNILWIYDKTLVWVVFDELINFWYLYKTYGEYPKIWISTKWIDAILNNKILLDENSLIQANLYSKLNNKKVFSKKTSKNDEIKVKVEKIDTYSQSYELYKEGKTLLEISKIRELSVQTIESHIIKLYEFWKINISQIMNFSQIDKLKRIKKIILENDLDLDKIQPIKNKLWEEYSYFDIKITISMILKKDL